MFEIEKNQKHVMVDLETLSLGFRPVIVSIGAVEFDQKGFRSEFYNEIDIEDAQRRGFTIDAGTVRWWMQQPDVAREVFQPQARPPTIIDEVLRRFSSWWPEGALFWGRGSLDERALNDAYRLLGIRPPWGYRDLRDFRTATWILPGVDVERDLEGEPEHHALGDAKYQARVLMSAMREASKLLAAMQKASK